MEIKENSISHESLSDLMMCGHKFYWINGFGEELNELNYEGLSSWFVSFRPVTEIYGAHFSYLIIHLSIIVCGFLTLKHAKTSGSRFVQFWWGAAICGLLSENGFVSPRHWHAQALVMLFGKRLPLHMIFFYPTVLYLSLMGVQKFELAWWSESAAAGVLAMIMKIPFRIVSVKFLHVTYHDSDPVYSSKFYGVPWIELFFDLVYAMSFIACYHLLKYNFFSEDHFRWKRVSSKGKEGMLMVASGVLSPLSAFLQKVIFFHLFHDIFNVNVQTCLLFLTTICLFIAMSCKKKPTELHKECQKALYGTEEEMEDENEDEVKEKAELHENLDVAGNKYSNYALYIYIGCLLYLGLLGTPQNEVSIGTHELTGDCTTLICTKTPLGKTLRRRKYLCVDEVQERNNFVYNFACLPDGPPSINAIWYTICGTPIRNRAQFLINIISFIILMMSIFLRGPLINENENRNGYAHWKMMFFKLFSAGRRGHVPDSQSAELMETNEASEEIS